MIYAFIIRNLKTALFIVLLSLAFSVNAQNGKIDNKSLSNPYGVSENDWRAYLNKTNFLLEKVDYHSFINFLVFNNDGNFYDMDYFLSYVSGKLKKDKQELIYRVGKGVITNSAEVTNYFASLQPLYNKYYLDFKSRRDIIVSSLPPRKAPGTGVFPTPSNCGSPCTNPGFESGTGFWDYSTGTACASSTSDPCSIVAGFSSSQHVIQTVGGFDPVVGAALPVVPPGGGSSSLMLGDGPTTGGFASRASISFTVSAANANLTYRYACVLQDPVSGHTDPERPYFNVHVRDGAGNLISCGEYNVIAKPPVIGFTETSPGSTIWWRNWTTVVVPLSSFIGQCITVQFTSSDCAQGGHYGYAYIDGDCDPLTLLSSSPSVCGGATVTLSAPPGAATYSWTNTAGGTTGIVGSTTGQTCTVNAGGTYQCVITTVAGPACATTLTITVGSSPSNPVASFTNTNVCTGTPTAFTDTSTPAGSITSWSWDFDGDGIADATAQNPSYTFPAAGTYPVTLISTMGPCNATITQNVTVNPIVPPAITAAGPFCTNAASVNLTGTPIGGTWSGTGITSASSGTFNPGTAVIGNNTITYTVTGACGGSTTSTVVVNPLPVTTVNSPSICPTMSATLTAAGATTYLWSTGSTANPINVSPVVTTTYTVTGTSLGCTSSAVSTVTVGGTLSPTVNSPTICAGVTATLTAAGGTTYLWNTGSAANPLSVSPLTTTSYTVTATTGGCSGTVVATVTVDPLPVLNITDPPAVCTPGTVDITAAAVTAGSTGAGVLSYWTDAAATISLATPTAIATSGTYYIQSTTAGGCTDINPVVVTINPLPVSNAGADIAFCSGATGNIGVATTVGQSYSWLATTGLSSSTISDPTVTLTIGGTTPVTSTYTVTTTITATGCTSTDQVDITVNPLPVLVITDPAAVCTPASVDITAASVTAGSTITGSTLAYWNDAAATSPTTTPTAISVTGIYYIQANASGGCSAIAPVNVTVNPTPVSDAGLDITICTGGIGTIGAASVAGNTYSWAPATGLSSSVASNPTVTLINGGLASTINTYTVTTTSAAGCTSTDVVDVIVDIVATANAGSAQNVCIGSSITLGGAIGGSASGGTWSGGTGTFSPNASDLNAVYTPSAAEFAAGSVILTLTTNDPTGPCTFASSNVTLSFYQAPVIAFTVDDPEGCPIHCVQFTNNSTVGGGDNIVSWAWDFTSNGSIDSTSQNPSTCYGIPGYYSVTLSATSNNGCTSTLMIPMMIQVFNVPVAEFDPTPNPASILDPIMTLNNQSSPDVISWWYYFGDGDSTAIVFPNDPSPVHSYPDVASSSYLATLYVQNSDGCMDTVDHVIEIGPEFTFYIPNAFTPNGDGINDFFFGQGIGIVEYDLLIFDRWGNMIFHGNDLNDMWDGKANGGSEVAQQDVYVWKVRLKDVFNKGHNYIGTVTLVK